MSTLQLNPEILTRNGEKMFAVIPYDEYLKLEERIEDVQDLIDLRQAREENKGEPGIPIEDVLKKYDLSGA